VSAAAIIIRLGWVFPVADLTQLLGRWLGRPIETPPKRNLFITSWAGMRGVVSLATALALPLVASNGQPFPQRNALLFITFTVILVTLLVQGLSLPWLVRRLGVQESPGERAAEEQALRLALTTNALAYLDTRLQADAPNSSLLTLHQAMQRQVRLLQGTFAANETTEPPVPSAEEAQATASFEGLLRSRLDVAAYQRKLLVKLYRTDTFSEEAIRQVEMELDRLEIALDTQLATVQQPESRTGNEPTI
jgi:CPA1 family monovalent cation:H+ antiporter